MNVIKCLKEDVKKEILYFALSAMLSIILIVVIGY